MSDRNNRVAEFVFTRLPEASLPALRAWMERARDPGDGTPLADDEGIDLANLGLGIRGGPAGSDASIMALLSDLAEAHPERDDYDLWGIVVRSAFAEHAGEVISLFEAAERDETISGRRPA